MWKKPHPHLRDTIIVINPTSTHKKFGLQSWLLCKAYPFLLVPAEILPAPKTHLTTSTHSAENGRDLTVLHRKSDHFLCRILMCGLNLSCELRVCSPAQYTVETNYSFEAELEIEMKTKIRDWDTRWWFIISVLCHHLSSLLLGFELITFHSVVQHLELPLHYLCYFSTNTGMPGSIVHILLSAVTAYVVSCIIRHTQWLTGLAVSSWASPLARLTALTGALSCWLYNALHDLICCVFHAVRRVFVGRGPQSEAAYMNTETTVLFKTLLPT